MQISPLPEHFSQLRGRKFAFYPPIHNLAHNEWIYQRATWSEIVVVNTGTGEEALVPRAFVGDVSIADHPLVIVGLKRELEWSEGALRTHRAPVIELPIAVNQSAAAAPHPDRPAPVVSIRLETHKRSHSGRKVAAGVMLGAIACWVAISIERQSQVHQRADVLALSRSYLQLSPGDDYTGVLQKLGPPAYERSTELSSGEHVRLLAYPHRQFTVVLAGIPPADPRYAGSLDPMGRILNATPLLRSLPRF
ncbi:MAG: hypothetical protein KGN36_04360 [Acidobacteriota bacterium]|nr:hypothetical protein [Acidobacteriota bacterium]